MPSINNRHLWDLPTRSLGRTFVFLLLLLLLFLLFSVLTITPCLFFSPPPLKIAIISSFVHFVSVFKIPFSILFSLEGREQGMFLACVQGKARTDAHMRIFSEELRKCMISSLNPFPSSSIFGSWGGKIP